MLSKNKIKFLQSLWQKKKREELGLFIVEGIRSVQEIVSSSITIETIIGSDTILNNFSTKDIECIEASEDEIKKISLQQSPQGIIAVCKLPSYQLPSPSEIREELTLLLDCVQDPGNMGTIIRLASWFGIRHIVCSPDSVDCFNPKVVQSTMGAIAKVAVHYTHLPSFIADAKHFEIPVFGTFLDGENIYSTNLPANGFIIMGNEGNGISTEIEKLVTTKICIPNYSSDQNNVESLNVGIATAIVCAEFKRRSSLF